MPAVGLYRAAGFFRGYLFLREGSPTHPLYTHYMSVGVWVQMYALTKSKYLFILMFLR